MNKIVQLQAGVTAARAALENAVKAEKEAVEVVKSANRSLARAKAELEEEQKREARRRIDRARDGAKRLASRIGVTIEKEDYPDGAVYWVHPPEGRYGEDGEGDPLDGCHSCVGWEEVLQAVETYEKAFDEEASR